MSGTAGSCNGRHLHSTARHCVNHMTNAQYWRGTVLLQRVSTGTGLWHYSGSVLAWYYGTAEGQLWYGPYGTVALQRVGTGMTLW